jgi:hypothetical protein
MFGRGAGPMSHCCEPEQTNPSLLRTLIWAAVVIALLRTHQIMGERALEQLRARSVGNGVTNKSNSIDVHQSGRFTCDRCISGHRDP